MVIADEHLVEFQALYRERFGKDISKDEALEKGLRLIRLLEAVSHIIANENQSQGNT